MLIIAYKWKDEEILIVRKKRSISDEIIEEKTLKRYDKEG